MSRVLALDWGTRRIGVAVSDDRRRIAVGYAIWPATEPECFDLLARTAKEEEIQEVVVGYPVSLNGTIGPAAKEVDEFIRKLEARAFRVVRWDERYSTQDVSREWTQLGISQRKQRGKLDMSAAVRILQSYLDAHEERGG